MNKNNFETPVVIYEAESFDDFDPEEAVDLGIGFQENEEDCSLIDEYQDDDEDVIDFTGETSCDWLYETIN